MLPELAPRNRDPKVIPRPDGEGCWMALYLSGNDYGLFESRGLIHWDKTCILNLPGCSECPDIYEIALDRDEKNKKMIFLVQGVSIWWAESKTVSLYLKQKFSIIIAFLTSIWSMRRRHSTVVDVK